jgi:hypothetical protein
MSQVPRILIASPTPGFVKTRYMKGIILTIRDMAKRGVDCDYVTADGTELVSMRNDLAAFFLRKPDYTHMFCVDADMVFKPDLCARMIAADKAVIGLIYPRKSLDFGRVAQALKAGLPLQSAVQLGQVWFYPRDGKKRPEPTAMLEVEWLGFGAVLIKRQAMESMIAKGVAKRQRAEDGGERYNFFGIRPQDVDGEEHVTEDISFCRRWKRDCGGEIWAMTDDVTHVGDFGYGGSYIEVLKALEKVQGNLG